MEEEATKLTFDLTTYRRLNIEHKINENLLKQTHLLNLRFYRSREELFARRQKTFEYQQRSSLTKQLADRLRKSNYQLYLNQQISSEHENQIKNNEEKEILLKKFDELKHTINDPHSTLSALAALSRSLFSLEINKMK